MTGPTILYTLADMAVALGVTPQALSNRRARGSGAGIQLPEPLYRTRSGRPLFTRAQIETVIAERAATARRALEEPGPCPVDGCSRPDGHPGPHDRRLLDTPTDAV